MQSLPWRYDSIRRLCHEAMAGARGALSEACSTLVPVSKAATRNGRELLLRAVSGRVTGVTSDPVRVTFALPYRCNFGQNLSLIGSSEALGCWDVRRSIDMHWTAGDVWKVDLELPASEASDAEVEYKYVVRNCDGGVAVWTPGENFSFHLDVSNETRAISVPEKVRILDAWDSSWREIEIELRQCAATSADGGEALAVQLAEDAEEALAALKSTVEDSSRLLETVSPVSEEALEADRAVAAAAKKASDLTRALNDLKSAGFLG